jgi:CheY-like chemotaxis protein
MSLLKDREMVGKTVPQQKPPISYPLTPHDDAKKLVSEVLKRVDQFIHKGDLDLAQVEIIKAKEVDPRNIYAHALEERISILKAELTNLEETQQVPASPGSKQITTVSLPASALSTPSIAPTSCSTVSPTQPQEKQEHSVLDRSVELESYRQALTQAWCDGALTESEERQLNELQIVFDITKTDCEQLEKTVKYECYRNALCRLLSDNSKNLSNQRSLVDLQRTYQISEEEHQYIQTHLMNTIEQKQRDKVLVIDDDVRLLELLTTSLEDNGFDVTALSTSDEAYTLLRKFTPDLILCDINLETSTMGGFTFYEKVQKLKNIQSVPFVFFTGLTDETLVRTGKELGVDDYLMKPISEQTLVSALRGKLKRFKQIKKLMDSPSHAMSTA